MAGINPILRVVPIIPPHILQEFNNDPNARQNFLFSTENPGHKLCELLNVFREYLNDDTLYNSIVQHAQMPYERKLFFLDGQFRYYNSREVDSITKVCYLLYVF